MANPNTTNTILYIYNTFIPCDLDHKFVLYTVFCGNIRNTSLV